LRATKGSYEEDEEKRIHRLLWHPTTKPGEWHQVKQIPFAFYYQPPEIASQKELKVQKKLELIVAVCPDWRLLFSSAGFTKVI